MATATIVTIIASDKSSNTQKVTNPYAKKRKLVSDDTSKNNAASAPTGLASTGPKSNTMTMTMPVSISHDTNTSAISSTRKNAPTS